MAEILYENSSLNKNRYTGGGRFQIVPMKSLQMVNDNYAGKVGFTYLTLVSERDNIAYVLPLPDNHLTYGATWVWAGQNISPLMSDVVNSERPREYFKDQLDRIGITGWEAIKSMFYGLGDKEVGTKIKQMNEGRIPNPNAQLLFSGPALETFEYEFTFIPFDKKIASNIKSGINQLFSHATPKLESDPNSGETPMYMGVPAYWNLSIHGPNNANKLLTRKMFAINSLRVNTSSNSFHSDGAPVEIKLSISCTEVAPVVRTDRQSIDITKQFGLKVL